MNEDERSSLMAADELNDGAITGSISRRRLLLLLGGTAGVTALASRGWSGRASAGQADVSPTLPVPSLPPANLGAPEGVPTVADLAASLNWDVNEMFRHVADEIRYDAYTGALRGPTGSLWAQAGNSVDQALLLAALLDEAVVPWRFAIGTLDDAAADDTKASVTISAEDAKARTASIVLPPDIAEAWSGEGPWTRAPEIDDLLSAARARVDATVSMITDALERVGVDPPEPDDSLPVEERERHVWLQYADGPNWIDLDPSVPGAEPGTVYGTPTETATVLPDDLFHTVTVRVVSEVVAAGEPTRNELLSHQMRSVDLAGVPVYLVHAPASWLDIAGAITGDQQYQPALLIGDTAVEGSLMSLALGEGVLDALGEEGDGAEGQTLSEWIEVEVAVPGRDVKQSSRTLFDRINPEKRLSGDLDLANLADIELTHIDDEIGDVFLPFAGAVILSIAGQPVPWSYFEDNPETTTPDTLIAQSAGGYDSLRELCRLELADRLGHLFYADEPSVTSLHVTPIGAASDGIQLVNTKIDLLHTSVRGVALAGADTGDRAGMLAGALDHAAERMLMNALVLLLPAPTPVDEFSVGRIFELATAQGAEVLTLEPGAVVDIPDLSVAAAALIDVALAAGRLVVIPDRAVTIDEVPRIGWWEYDALTGVLLDRLDDGGRAAANEYAHLVRIATMASCGFAVLGSLAFVAKAIQGKLNSLTDATDGVSSVGGAIAGCAAGGFALP